METKSVRDKQISADATNISVRTVDSELAELDEVEREFSEEIKSIRRFVNREFDQMHKEIIAQFGQELEQEFAESIEGARALHNSKLDETQKAMTERVARERKRVRQNFCSTGRG